MMPHQMINGDEFFARHLILEAAVIAIINLLDKIVSAEEAVDWRASIEKEIPAFNYPTLPGLNAAALDELMRLISLSKEDLVQARK